MSSFRFNGDAATTASVRRSPRLSTPLSTTSSPAPSPQKRRVAAASAPAAAAASKSAVAQDISTQVTTTNTSTSNTRDSPAGSPSPTKKQRRRPKAGYAPPSTYAHLPPLPDRVAPNLLVLFVGLNPGIQTASTGHAYAHPSNLFWKLLASSGVTPVACRPQEDATMPARFNLGLTNIVSRPSRNGAELRGAELDAGVEVLEAKARRWRPEAVCIVGKSIWESIYRVRRGRALAKADFRYGWQADAENMGRLRSASHRAEAVEDGVVADPAWNGARVFVATSTSGLAASLSPREKEDIWRELGVWVERRREERKKEAS